MTTLEFPPDIGGVGESVHRIAKMLIALGYEVHVAVFRAVFRNERALAAAGDYRLSSCQTTEIAGIMVHRLLPAVRSPQAKEQDYFCDLYAQLASLHRQHKFDLLHAFFINEMGFLTTLLGQESGIPVINSVRGADLHKHIFSPQQFGPITWTLANSAWTTFVSQDLMHRARTLVPAIRHKSSAFWNSIDPNQLHYVTPEKTKEPFINPSSAESEEIIIGSVGSFRDKKGLEYLFEACQFLRKQLLRDQAFHSQSLNQNTLNKYTANKKFISNLFDSTPEITLLLIGDFAEKERDYWEQALQESGFADRTVITGRVSRQKALSYLSYVDIFAIPSLHDGCPNAMIEAMLGAKAVVGSNVDAIGEILEDGINGLVIPPADTGALAEALRRLISQPNFRQQLGIAARQTALNQLAPAVEQQHWEKVYQQVFEDSSVSSQKRPDSIRKAVFAG
ncbi:MAG: glycosyltransferase [Cyanobacteria bacterium J06614_10]